MFLTFILRLSSWAPFREMCWFSGENEAANLKTIFLIANYYWVNFVCVTCVVWMLSGCCLGVLCWDVISCHMW